MSFFSRFTNIFIVIIIALTVTSCFIKSDNETKGNPLARAGERFLYFDDVREIIPKNLSRNDSLAFLKNFINKWIKKQVTFEKAELTLSEKQKDVSRQLDEYRRVILMNKFEQNIIARDLDTTITAEEIDAFYEKNKNDLKLKENIIKPLFVRVPKNAPNLANVKIWYKSERDDDIDKLVKFTFKNKGDFFYDENEWYIFRDFIKKLPLDIGSSEESFLKSNRFIEFKDSLDLYYLNIKDYKLNGEIPPPEYIKGQIKSVILNKRKMSLIRDIEIRLFNEALEEKHAEIYSDDIKNYSDTLIFKDTANHSIKIKK